MATPWKDRLSLLAKTIAGIPSLMVGYGLMLHSHAKIAKEQLANFLVYVSEPKKKNKEL